MIPTPFEGANYKILRSTIDELMGAGLVQPLPFFSLISS